jgi:Lipopolysaccharide-assembly
MHESTKARWAVVLLLATQVACGYKVATQNRVDPDIGTLAVLPLENKTATFEVEQILTRSLVRAFVEKSSYTVVSDSSQADAVFQGVISQVSANPVIFGEQTFGSTFLVTVVGRVELRERETSKLIFESNNFIFREQYVINVDVQNFFSELNPALGRIADDFASSVVTTILERF